MTQDSMSFIDSFCSLQSQWTLIKRKMLELEIGSNEKFSVDGEIFKIPFFSHHFSDLAEPYFHKMIQLFMTAAGIGDEE